MNRKEFLSGLAVVALSPKLTPDEEIYDDYEELYDDEIDSDYERPTGEKWVGNFRDLVSTKTIDGSELHFVRYKTSK